MSQNKRQNFAVDPHYEIDSTKYATDVRRPIEKIAATLKSKPFTLLALWTVLIAAIVVQALITFIPIIGLFFVLTYYFIPDGPKQGALPPLRAPAQDPAAREYRQLGNNTSPIQAGTGIFYLGTEIGTGRELWMSNEDSREHFWITGTTGSGKTELLMAIMMNALSWGSGFVMIDGKGDIATAGKIWRMARQMARTDDVFILNFMVPSRNAVASGMLSHTLNPFATYSKSEMMQVIESLLPKASGDSGGWQQKAIALMRAVVTQLVWLRDFHGKPLSVQSLQEGMVLDNILRSLLPKEICAPIYKDMPTEVREPLANYANNLSSFPRDLLHMPADGSPHPLAKPGTPYKFVDQTNTQHGFLTSILGPPLALLGESYRHIFGPMHADIDVFDIVLNRRILVVILPALQKSLEDMGNLGRITVSTLKTMLGDALGGEIEGTVASVYDNRVTSAPSPFEVILDEWTYYITQGAAMMPAQARGIGFAFFFAVQSLSAIFQRDGTEGRDAYGTVNTRIFMFAVDEDTTIKSALETAGKADIVKPTVFSYGDTGGGLTNSPKIGQDRQIQNIERITGRHIRRLGKGEFYLMRGDTIVLALGPYIDDASLTALDKRQMDADGKDGESSEEEAIRDAEAQAAFNQFFGIHLNHLVTILPESPEDIAARQSVDKFVNFIRGDQEEFLDKIAEQSRGKDEIGLIHSIMDQLPDVPALEASCVALARLSADVQSARMAGSMQRSNSSVSGYTNDSAAPSGTPMRGRGPKGRNNLNINEPGAPANRVSPGVSDPVSKALSMLSNSDSEDDADEAIADALGKNPKKIKRRKPVAQPAFVDDEAPWLQDDDKDDGIMDAGSETKGQAKAAEPEKEPVKTDEPTAKPERDSKTKAAEKPDTKPAQEAEKPQAKPVSQPAPAPTPTTPTQEPKAKDEKKLELKKDTGSQTASQGSDEGEEVRSFLSNVLNATVLDGDDDDDDD